METEEYWLKLTERRKQKRLKNRVTEHWAPRRC
nr:MAG TPA: hypothetical protein [Caudoviricetes sp.]